MAVNRVPVLKRCRSLGLDPIYLGIDKKSKRGAANGRRQNKKLSEYGLQMREKQKAKFIYGVLEKPFHNYYVRAKQMKGQTGENLMMILEQIKINTSVLDSPNFVFAEQPRSDVVVNEGRLAESLAVSNISLSTSVIQGQLKVTRIEDINGEH